MSNIKARVIVIGSGDMDLKDDGILACGEHTMRRLKRTVDLWNRHIGLPRPAGKNPYMYDLVVVSGGALEGLPPAAPSMKEQLIADGIPAEVIQVEPKAADTYENVLFSIERLEELGYKLEEIEITVVAQWQHAIRFWLAFRAHKITVKLVKLHYWMTLREYLVEFAFIAYHLFDPLGIGKLAIRNREDRKHGKKGMDWVLR